MTCYDEDFLREQLEERYVTYGDMDELNDEFVNESWSLLGRLSADGL